MNTLLPSWLRTRPAIFGLIEICDSCGLIQRGGGLRQFETDGKCSDICEACQQQPFRVLDTRAKKRALKERIEALIETERKLESQA